MPSGDADSLRIKTLIIPRSRLSRTTRYIPHLLDDGAFTAPWWRQVRRDVVLSPLETLIAVH
jgi:hypothetical protein